MTISENKTLIEEEIAKVAAFWDRDPSDIQLMAVSKKQPAERIEEALAAGQRLFGENRVQEAQERWAERKQKIPDLELHLIGPLQTNKVKDAVALFDCIQTIDRPKLASALKKEIDAQNKSLPCFIQVNTGEEEQKAGVSPQEFPELLEFCQKECGLNITGLMCIPPIEAPAAVHFAFLQKLANEHNIRNLSMGMSSDYARAIPLGTTMIRVGTTFFGEREN